MKTNEEIINIVYGVMSSPEGRLLKIMDLARADEKERIIEKVSKCLSWGNHVSENTANEELEELRE